LRRTGDDAQTVTGLTVMKLDTSTRIVIGALAAIVFLAYEASQRVPAPAGPSAASPESKGLKTYQQASVVMYSLTTCGYCKLMARELTARNIQFTEYFIDAEPARLRELTAKLERAGFRPGPIGTPTLEVNGVMLPNNPSIKTVLKHL